MIDALFDTAATLPWPAVLAVVVACAYLESALFVGLVVPGETALLAGGALAARSGGPWILFVVLAGLGGDLTSHEVGRRYGPRLRRSWAGRRLGEERWQRAEDLLARQGGRAVFVGRFLPLVQAVVPALAGAVGMPRRRPFLPWCAAGALTWSAVYVTVGVVAGESSERVGSSVSAALAALGLATVAVLALRRVTTRRRAASGC
jgi:membrane-associated protein